MTNTRKNELHDISFLLQNGSSSRFAKIVQKAQILDRVNRVFLALIDGELAKHCYVIEVSKTTIDLLVDNSAWATVLHYSIPEIIKSLNKQPEFNGITKIKYQVKKG